MTKKGLGLLFLNTTYFYESKCDALKLGGPVDNQSTRRILFDFG